MSLYTMWCMSVKDKKMDKNWYAIVNDVDWAWQVYLVE